MTSDRWNVAEETSGTNRYGNFSHFAELTVYGPMDPSWNGPVRIEALWKTGTPVFQLALSREDAERMRDALIQILTLMDLEAR